MPGVRIPLSSLALTLLALGARTLTAAEADLIFTHGKICTVDKAFTICSALAIKEGAILATGSDAEMLAHRGEKTEVIDLHGRAVIPGLIDSHVHPTGAALTEFDHPIPEMQTIDDVLQYFRDRAKVTPKGEWIDLQQVFITRLREQRYPTRAELDAAAPDNPVYFRTGPDASVNTLALQLSQIDRDFVVKDGGSGFAEKDTATGEPTGILRGCTRYVPVKVKRRQPTEAERSEKLQALFRDYNSVGLTTICDRDASLEAIELYRDLREQHGLTVRLRCSESLPIMGPIEKVEAHIRGIGHDPLHTTPDDWVRIIGTKVYLDGGMLTGSAYMREPWGVSAIYGITDPQYRGVLNISHERLVPLVRAVANAGLQFTAHSVGDGAVHELLDVYEALSAEGVPIRENRCCVTHSNFMSRVDVERAARLGVMEDIQPAWLYLDAATLLKHFGNDRLRWFQPLHTIFAMGGVAGGGSDHMQKIGSLRSINPYNPFLGMATTVTRRARGLAEPLHLEEALTREEMLRFYTINNARILFMEDRVGSLEPGKLADLAVLDRDLLTCPAEQIAATTVLATYLGGKRLSSVPGWPK